MWELPSFDSLQKSLSDPSNPIGMRMRAAYYLRQLYTDVAAAEHDDCSNNGGNGPNNDPFTVTTQDVINTLCFGLNDGRHGSLMRHEFAYVLGQLRDAQSCDTLERILLDENDCIMVRHECAEALGAIGSDRSLPILNIVMEKNTHLPEISETCQLAINVMEWRSNGSDPETQPATCACMLNPYSTTDPAPPHPSHADTPIQELGNILLNNEQTMFERYRAMFSLRNRGGTDAVVQLCRALTDDTSSALLRHEVAYVLGQMQHPISVEALEISLRRTNEHPMVRHESAEALGAIDGRWEDVERILLEFTNDHDIVVSESCLVALDAADYWRTDQGTAEESNTDDCGKDQTSTTASFAQQKADQKILLNHFNIKDDRSNNIESVH
jgi:deoxyhypusine monooxygenase